MDGEEISLATTTTISEIDKSLTGQTDDLFGDELGCYIDEHEIYLIQNHDVVVQQISQWLIVMILPITTLIFVYAGWQAQRTHGFCAFDSMVLYLCAIYNLFQMY